MSEEHLGSRAVSVRVENFNEMTVPTEEHEPEHFSFFTVTLQPGQNPLDSVILALDPLRKDAAILPIDAPIVLCDTASKAASAGNQVANFPAPDGAYIPQGVSIAISGTAGVWGACQAATRVSVIVNRRRV